MKKNVASQIIGAQLVNAADGTAFTGTATVVVTIDGGTQSASGGTGPTHEGNGFHSYVPTQAETNGDHVAFTFTGTGAVPATVQVYPTFPQTGDNFARLGAPAGASISADIATVDTVVDGIQTDLSNGTDGLGAIKADTAAILTDTDELQADDVPGLIAALNDLSAAQVNTEVDTALADIHLDHLFATDYDPASKPGTATALLNELIENDGGVSRYTVNALENGPSGSGASAASIADAVWDEAFADHQTAGSFGSVNDVLALTAAQVNAECDTAISDASLATAASISALNDIAATDIVTGGAINTTGGAVDNVTLVATTTTNTDMVTEPPTAIENADALLKRDMSAVTGESARSPLNALRFLRNKWTVSGGTLTVYEEDDVTAAWTGSVSSDAAADPVTGNDPA